MPKQSYAEDINSAKVMISGLKANAERVSKRGLESGFVAKLEALHESARSLDNEQEDLKAKLKTKTAALETKMDELGAMMTEARKVVKLEMESESWKSFGISASR